MVADTLQIKRGTSLAVSSYTPAIGEPVYDTTNKALYVGDGVTAGGYRVGSLTSSFGASLVASVDATSARTLLGAAASGANTDITSITGSASKLTTSRTLSTTGDATWSVSFDGSANVTSAIALATTGVTAGTYGGVTVDTKGRVTAATTLLPITNGGTNASTATTARANLGAASSGANSDITSLSGLTTPLSIAQGGTGLNAQTFTNFTLQNSWVVIASRRAAYRKVIDMVQVEMQIASGTATDGTLLATLPVGFRPPFVLAIPVQSAPNTTPSSTVAMPRVIIGTDGTITCQNCTAANGIQFVTLFSTV